MSRTEELRAKLRKPKEYDQKFSDFDGLVYKFTVKNKSASALSTDFVKKLYEKFKNEGAESAELWIAKNLHAEFKSENAQPNWIVEPSWCFHDGDPMTFIHQFTDAEDITFYVFRGDIETELGTQAIYKMIAQDREGAIHLKGEIIG